MLHGSDKTASGSWFRNKFNFPKLSRDQRRELTGRVREGAACDWDYLVMMSLASALAALGLLQDSTAVVIGAMLVAPLMGPLIGAALALTQGNLNMFKDAMRSVLIGIALGFFVACVVGLANPGFEPALEIESRGNPDVLDLGIAFASGMVGAYAIGRPKVAVTIAGVAIAAALVPPLVVVGIALTNERLYISAAASILLLTNIVAIILGAALVFRMLGVRVWRDQHRRYAWTQKISIALVSLAVLLSGPLMYNAILKGREGTSRPLTYPVSTDVREAVRTWINQQPGVNVLMLGRISVEPDTGIVIILVTERRLDSAFKQELIEVIQQARGGTPAITIHAVLSDDAAPTIDPSNSPR
jgi:uncharacterized hydrophobic protein (TIGR00271 family)